MIRLLSLTFWKEMYWGDMKLLIGNQRFLWPKVILIANLDAEWRFVAEVIDVLTTVEKTQMSGFLWEWALKKASSDLCLLISPLCHCVWSVATDIVSCRGWRTEFWGLDSIFLGENTVCEITDTADACVMIGGNVSRFRIKCDSAVP